MENDTIVSTELANQREQQMFTLKSESEASILKLQGDYDILKQRLQLSEQEARHARSELEQATESNFCFDPQHQFMQEDLDSAQLEIIEARSNETQLEAKISSLKEQVAERSASASALGRKIAQGRRESSGSHPTLQTLLEEEKQEAEAEHLFIIGSELVIAGWIPKKVGNRRFTCFGNDNEYFGLVKLSMQQSDAEDDSDEVENQEHNRLSMDTEVPEMPKHAMMISSDEDGMQEFVKDIDKQYSGGEEH